jgi:hypothetical protein
MRPFDPFMLCDAFRLRQVIDVPAESARRALASSLAAFVAPPRGGDAAPDAADGALVAALLPPRWHVLVRVAVRAGDARCTVRTDYWPCLQWLDAWLDGVFAPGAS